MSICRLCLQYGGRIVRNSQELLKILKQFLSYLNKCLKHSNLQLCDICLTSIQTLTDLQKILNRTNEKIKTHIEKSNSSKIILSNLLETNNGFRKDSGVCRICLKIICVPQVFLYDSETNILRHDLILFMFKYCKVMLNCDLSESPMMCVQCLQNLQVCYSFKKNCLEIDKKIKTYFKLFKISKSGITDDTLNKISKYFEQPEHVGTDIKVMINNDVFSGDNTNCKGYSLRKRIKKEYSRTLSSYESIIEGNELKIKGGLNAKFTSKRSRHCFTNEDDEFLLKAYGEVKNTNNKCLKGWKQIQDKWMESFPTKPLRADSIRCRLNNILKRKQNNKSTKVGFAKEKPVVHVDNRVINVFGDPAIETAECDSDDDSFVDELIPASFMPNTNLEPLSDNEERYIIEPKFELLQDCPPDSESDTESLPIPLLERMDVAPMIDLKTKDIYSIELKRETLATVTSHEEVDSNVTVDDCKIWKRISIKCQDHVETLYKCIKCNFETKYQYSADRHSDWHANPNKKSFQCEKCPFITSTHFLLNHHRTTEHQENDDDIDDLPVLVPYTITY